MSWGFSLALAVFTLFAWGTWSNVLKGNHQVPLTLLMVDFGVGTLFTSVMALTAGLDERILFAGTGTSLTQEVLLVVCSLASGVTNSVGNLLIGFAISAIGLALAVPISLGISLGLGTVGNFIIDPHGADASLLFTGVVLALLAVLCQARAAALMPAAPAASVSSRSTQSCRNSELPLEAAPPPDPEAVVLAAALVEHVADVGTSLEGSEMGDDHPTSRLTPASRRSMVKVGLALSCTTGLMYMSSGLLATIATTFGGAMTPLGINLVFSIGSLPTTVLLVPLIGRCGLLPEAIVGSSCRRATLRKYVRLRCSEHLWGFAGGSIFCLGGLAVLVAGSDLGVAVSIAIGQASPLVSTVWGILWFGEYRGCSAWVKLYTAAMMALYATAVVFVALSARSTGVGV